MTPAEQTLLLAVFRWARANGWIRLDNAWLSKEASIALIGSGLYIYRRSPHRTATTNGSPVAEAVEVLVAFGILPPRFSSSYAAGYDAVRWVDALRKVPRSLSMVPGPAVADAIAAMQPVAPLKLWVET